jgi:hypothetical protein
LRHEAEGIKSFCKRGVARPGIGSFGQRRLRPALCGRKVETSGEKPSKFLEDVLWTCFAALVTATDFGPELIVEQVIADS